MYDFDEIIDRNNTNAMNTDGYMDYMFKGQPDIEFPCDKEEMVRMWIADMEFATPDVIIEGIKDRLDKRILGYSKVFAKEYYEAFANWCNIQYGWSFDINDLVISNGIIPALYELVDYILEDDEKILFLTPSYAYFKYAADFHNKESVCCDLINNDNYFAIDFEDLARKARDPKTKLFIFCNPHNPTGRIWKKEELRKIAKIIKDNDLWIISDEIHCDLIRSNQSHLPMGKILNDYQKLITCMAPTKTFNIAGMMISNVIIKDEDLRELWCQRHYNFDNPLSIAAAQAAYEKGHDWLKELKLYLDGNFKLTQDYLQANLPQAKFRISEATYLAWIDLSFYFGDNEDLPLFFAKKAGVLLEAGEMFVKNANCFIRLNLACPKATLTKGLERICTAVLTNTN